MHTTLNLTLTNEINNHFENVLNQIEYKDESQLISEAKAGLSDLKSRALSSFVMTHIKQLEEMLKMLQDDKWSLTETDKKAILSASHYLLDNNDVIPDDIPKIGLLDDCIIIDIAAKKTKKELDNYQDFDKTRKIYAKDNEFNINDWRKTKRQESFSRLRNRRNKRG